MKNNTWKLSYTDSLRALTLDLLDAHIAAFRRGNLADFAQDAQAMEEHDDVLKNVIAKRKKAIARHGYEILTLDDSPEAQAHKAALQYFYANLTVSNLLKEDQSGGVGLLVYQMMDALAKGWAIHEIAWRPSIDSRSGRSNETPISSSPHPRPAKAGTTIRDSEGKHMGNNLVAALGTHWAGVRGSASAAADSFPSPLSEGEKVRMRGSTPSLTNSSLSFHPSSLLTAELRFVPLWFFDHTQTHLRFKPNPLSNETEPLNPNQWLITVAEPLMLACGKAYLFKQMPLRAWLDYCQKYGSPGIRGVTPAQRGTAEWDAMTTALQDFTRELSVVTNSGENIQLIDLKGSGEPPYIRLIDRMDRVMISLWRGADLSTFSRDNGYGASLQSQESRILEIDDAKMIAETLNNSLDLKVLRHLFGPNTQPKAYIQILCAAPETTAQDLEIDKFLTSIGIKLDQTSLLQRYNRTAERSLNDQPKPVQLNRSERVLVTDGVTVPTREH